jgi:hypothetical protein
MKNIFYIGWSIFIVVFGILGLNASIFGLPLIFVGLYFLPFTQRMLFKEKVDGSIKHIKFSTQVFVFTFFIIFFAVGYFYELEEKSQKDNTSNIVEAHKKNPESTIEEVRILISENKFIEAELKVSKLMQLMPEDQDVKMILDAVKASHALYNQNQKRPAPSYANERPSSSYIKEDPRNVYLYCVGSTMNCYKTPAECDLEKKFHNDSWCSPVACGTGVTHANTAKCQAKGF